MIKSVTTLAAATFRSMPEALRYLKSLQDEAERQIEMVEVLSGSMTFTDEDLDEKHNDTLPDRPTVINKSIPGITLEPATQKELKERFDKSAEFVAQYKELRLRVNEWTSQWGKSPEFTKLIEEVRKTQKILEKAIVEQRAWLERITKGAVPKEFTRLANSIEKVLLDRAAGNYDGSQSRTMLWTKDDRLYVTRSIKLENFRDRTGSVTDSYYVVITLQWDGKQSSTHIVTHQEYEHPGTYNIGESFTSAAEGRALLETLLDLDSHDTQIHDAPLPMETQDVEGMKFTAVQKKLIKNLSLSDDRTLFQIRTTKFMTDTSEDMKSLLAAIFSNLPSSMRRGKVKFSMKAETTVVIPAVKSKKRIGKLQDSVADLEDWTFYENEDGAWQCDIVAPTLRESKVLAAKCIKAARDTDEGAASEPVSSTPVSLITFRMSAGGKKPEIRRLREFIENMKDHGLNASQIYLVRRALGA